MAEPDNLMIPHAPETMRATPQAIAHELEPFIERITIAVLSEFNRRFTDVIAILERDRFSTAAAIADLKAMVSEQLVVLLNKLLELEQRQVKSEAREKRHSRRIADQEKRIADHAKRISALEAKKKRAKRHAHHSR